MEINLPVADALAPGASFRATPFANEALIFLLTHLLLRLEFSNIRLKSGVHDEELGRRPADKEEQEGHECEGGDRELEKRRKIQGQEPRTAEHLSLSHGSHRSAPPANPTLKLSSAILAQQTMALEPRERKRVNFLFLLQE